MLVVHHIIDALRDLAGKHKVHRLLELPGVDMTRHRPRLLRSLQEAEKFDFGVLHLEPYEGEPGVYQMPAITGDELQFWREGLLPLPAPVCWYEYTLGTSRSGLLITESSDGDTWTVERIDYGWQGTSICADGLQVSASKTAALEQAKHPNPGIEVLKQTAVADGKYLSALMACHNDHQALRIGMGSAIPMALYMTLMLYSRTTEVAHEREPTALNKKRVRNGKTPLAAHRIVTIVPARFREEAAREGRIERRPPRLHWRRSHKRHYDHHVPSAKWAPTEVHNGTTGWWVSIIARCLVSKAELGEVSHEYRMASLPAAAQSQGSHQHGGSAHHGKG